MTLDDDDTIKQATVACVNALAGLAPELQAAILADLLALWLAGYQGTPDDEDIRERLLAGHIELVRDLVPLNEEMLWGRDG